MFLASVPLDHDEFASRQPGKLALNRAPTDVGQLD